MIADANTEIDNIASLNASDPLATKESEFTSLPFFIFSLFPQTSCWCFLFFNDCDIINLWKKLKKKTKIVQNSLDG